MATNWSEDQKAEALRLHVEVGPCEASRRTGIPRETISSWASKEGLGSVVEGSIACAIEAAKTRRSERKAQLAADLLDDAHRLREQLWSPAMVHHWGTNSERDGSVITTTTEFMEHEIAEPTFGDKRSILQGLAVAVDKSMALAGEQIGKQGLEVTGKDGGAIEVKQDVDPDFVASVLRVLGGASGTNPEEAPTEPLHSPSTD